MNSDTVIHKRALGLCDRPRPVTKNNTGTSIRWYHGRALIVTLTRAVARAPTGLAHPERPGLGYGSLHGPPTVQHHHNRSSEIRSRRMREPDCRLYQRHRFPPPDRFGRKDSVDRVRKDWLLLAILLTCVLLRYVSCLNKERWWWWWRWGRRRVSDLGEATPRDLQLYQTYTDFMDIRMYKLYWVFLLLK